MVQPWLQGIDPEKAEKRVHYLRQQIAEADFAIEAQQKLIPQQGQLETYQSAINSLLVSQRNMERELAELMRKRDVEILDFALDGRPFSRHRANAKALAIFFESLQRLFNRLGQALHSPRVTPTIPEIVRRQCQLDVAGFYPSSFGVRFTAPTNADLAGSSLSGEALECLFELVNSDHPVEQAARFGHWAMTSYRHLISTMVKVEATPKVSWVTADGGSRSWIADHQRLKIIQNRLASIRHDEPQILQASGTLTGASLRRHKFEFNGDSLLITGVAPTELSEKLTTFFGKRCRITYTENVSIDEATEQTKRTRILVDVDPE